MRVHDSQSLVSESKASASSDNLLQMQSFRPHLGPREPKTGMRLAMCFNKPSRWLVKLEFWEALVYAKVNFNRQHGGETGLKRGGGGRVCSGRDVAGGMDRRFIKKGFICYEKNFGFYPENNGEPLKCYTMSKKRKHPIMLVTFLKTSNHKDRWHVIA